MTYWQIIYLMFLHWLFDFKFQSHKMATNKSKSVEWLSLHCSVYALLALFLFKPIQDTCMIYLMLLTSHLYIDGISSKITSWLFKKNEYHYFFCVIGLDQILHYMVLFQICK